MQSPVIDPVALIREDHKKLAPHLAHLEGAAAEMASASDDQVLRQLSTLAAFLRDHILDRAESEERDLYPVVERLLRTLGGATDTMSRDHETITAKVEALEHLSESVRPGLAVDPAQRAEATRLLYGLAELLENHFAKEEEVYLPLLERGLSPDEAETLAKRLTEGDRPMTDFEVVASLGDIPDGGMKQVEFAGEPIGLFKVGKDVFAIHDICTHEHAYLTDGEFDSEEFEVECPRHGSRFNVRTGAVRVLPATRPVDTYHVRLNGDEVLVGSRNH